MRDLLLTFCENKRAHKCDISEFLKNIIKASAVPPTMRPASHTSFDSEASVTSDGASVPHPERSISGASSGKFPMNWGQTGSCGSSQVCGVRGFFKPPR